MLSVYVDDTLTAGTEDFMKLINKIPEEFDSKQKAFPPLLFSGVIIKPDPLRYFVEQKNYSEKIDTLHTLCFREFPLTTVIRNGI